MGFVEAEAFLDSLGVDAMKGLAPSLERMNALCAALDHPERKLSAIHVTGTNGKTSTARIASAILTATGLSVGTYTSPHLETVRERITLDGIPISEGSFGDVFDHLKPYIDHVEERLGESLTYFEILTAMFFLWAVEMPVDAVVVEVGLGGRWDATNVLTAPVAIITNVGLDHTGLLGSDRATIAKEKAGIIGPDAVVVTSERYGDAADVIQAEARAVSARTMVSGEALELTKNTIAVGGRYVSCRVGATAYDDLFLPLHGAHQAENAALAVAAVASFLPATTLDREVIAEGLARSEVPGRLESMRMGQRSVILDVAHNPDGMSALVSSLIEAFAFEQVIFVVGVLADKDLEGMLREIARVPCKVIATEAASVRSHPTSEIRRIADGLGLECHAIADVVEAVSYASENQDETQIVCVTGSHYVVGEARSRLRAQ